MAYRLAPRAATDLEEIWTYVARGSGNPDTACRLIASINDRILLIGSHPYAGRSRSDDLGPGRRSFAVGEYVIVYSVRERDVLVLRIIHGRRNLAALFGE